MIAYVRGRIEEVYENRVILDVHDIGYQVFITSREADHLPPKGETVLLHTYFYVKEEAMQLYGFQEPDDLEVFRLLLGVNGIGPKAAMGVLAALSADDLRFAVLSDDVKTISRAPGIGPKTAKRMILDLKDKLSLEEAFEKRLEHGPAGASASGERVSDARAEAVEALVALGYSNTDALGAVRAAAGEEDLDAEQILKMALKQMSYR